MRYDPEDTIQYKIKFEGKVLSVQPRLNVWRYRLDNRDSADEKSMRIDLF